MFTPTTTGCRPRRARRAHRACRLRRCAAAAAAPALLKPIRFTTARSAGSRNIRGRGLPGCARAVTVPTSTNAKPSAPSASAPRASLSNPAASPSGPGRSRPSARTRRTGSRGASQRRSNQATPGSVPAARISQNPAACAVSAGSRRSSTRYTSSYIALPAPDQDCGFCCRPSPWPAERPYPVTTQSRRSGSGRMDAPGGMAGRRWLRALVAVARGRLSPYRDWRRQEGYVRAVGMIGLDLPWHRPGAVRFCPWRGGRHPVWWAVQGYAVVNCDLRGAGTWEGTASLLSAQEGEDVHDLIEWAAAQPWSTGAVGMLGLSYLAISQWEAAALRPPGLKGPHHDRLAESLPAGPRRRQLPPVRPGTRAQPPSAAGPGAGRSGGHSPRPVRDLFQGGGEAAAGRRGPLAMAAQPAHRPVPRRLSERPERPLHPALGTTTPGPPPGPDHPVTGAPIPFRVADRADGARYRGRKSSSSRLIASGASSCIQWPGPSTRS